MKRAVVVSNIFDGTWPFSADYLKDRWLRAGETFVRLSHGDVRALGELGLPDDITQLVCLGVSITPQCVTKFTSLRELGLTNRPSSESPIAQALRDRNIAVYAPQSEGFWGQSVSEFALGLTIGGLRRIPQTYAESLTSHDVWKYTQPGGVGVPGARGSQFGDDANFTNGTIAGKRVRVVGLGNIGSRYAAFCDFLGADVAAWDPVAQESVFHRTGARRVRSIPELVKDAEIFAAMLPLMDATRGIVDAAAIDALPRGTLVVLVTRMGICDAKALRRRVLADELALAADVFDVEPLPLDDPLLGRHNVIHTPHNAGRTMHANHAYMSAIVDQFE
jgi:phosphoglycerate dehydrogenase-like enzyme